MADKVPVRASYSGANALTGLATFASSETIGIAHGGTGIATVGTNQLVTGNGTSAMTSESNLTFDGSTLLVSGTASAVSVMAADSGASLASQDASKIILVDLTDPGTLWDVQKFLVGARFTSWYQELGAPPMRGAMWINNATTTVIWWNLDTDALYMSFTLAANQGIPSAGAKGFAFLDGRLYTANGPDYGVGIVDFLTDNLWTYWTGGEGLYKGGISERNDTLAFNTLRATPAIVSMGANDIAAVRDRTIVDEFGRPIHWWAVSTATKISVYSPVDDAIYDSAAADNGIHAMKISPGGIIIADTYSGDDWVDGYDIFGITADDFARNMQFYPDAAANRDGASVIATGSGATINDVAVTDGLSPTGQSTVVMAEDGGLQIFHFRYHMNGTMILQYRITSTYNITIGASSAAGSLQGAWPLNSITDYSGRGNNLTNTNSVTFTSGVFGNAATFISSSSQQLEDLNDSDYATPRNIAFWFKTTSSTNPAAINTMVHLTEDNAVNAQVIQIYFQTDGTLTAYYGGVSIDPTVDLYDATWHSLVFSNDDDGTYLWVDGILLGSSASAPISISGIDNLYVGGRGTQYCDMQIEQLTISKTGWEEAEAKAFHNRMMRGLGGATAVLANTDVKSVRVDQNTGLAAITTAANQTEIWDIEMGMRESIDATTTATIADADVRLKTGAILPEYITGRSGAIEFDGQERNVIG